MEETRRQGRRRQQLPEDLKENRIRSKLKKEAPDRAPLRTRFEEGRTCRTTD
jgi:hypothetical protein